MGREPDQVQVHGQLRGPVLATSAPVSRCARWPVRRSAQPGVRAALVRVFQEWLFRTTPFRDAGIIYEFGCGSGINLAKLASIYPTSGTWGSTGCTVRSLSPEAGRQRGWRMEGRSSTSSSPTRRPDRGRRGRLHLGALEQTGDAWHAFLDYLLQFRPAACVHIEPIVEWYGDWTPFDYAAKRFHRARRYWTGFPDKLKALAEEERIQILKQKRSDFGSLYLEGYSQLIWRPL